MSTSRETTGSVPRRSRRIGAEVAVWVAVALLLLLGTQLDPGPPPDVRAGGDSGLTSERGTARSAADQLRLGETKALIGGDVDGSRVDVAVAALEVVDPLPASSAERGPRPGWRYLGIVMQLENRGRSSESATDRSDYSAFGATQAELISDADQTSERISAFLVAGTGRCTTVTSDRVTVPSGERTEFCIPYSLPQREMPVALRYPRLSFEGLPAEWALR